MVAAGFQRRQMRALSVGDMAPRLVAKPRSAPIAAATCGLSPESIKVSTPRAASAASPARAVGRGVSAMAMTARTALDHYPNSSMTRRVMALPHVK